MDDRHLAWAVLLALSLASLNVAHAKAPDGNSWQLFRGNSQSTGVAISRLPQELKVLWKFRVENGAFDGTAAIADGAVYIGDLDGKLFALDLKSGNQRWELTTEIGFATSPAIRDGRLYIGDIDGKFYCVDAGQGEIEWTFETEAEINSSANFYQDKVLVGSQDATLYCLNAETGKLAWKHVIEDQIRCTPTIIGDRTFLAGCDARLHIIDLSRGAGVDGVDISAPTGVTPAARGDFVYFGTEAGAFFCIDWKQAKVAWVFEDEQQSQPFRSCPALDEDIVVVGSRSKRVLAFESGIGRRTVELRRQATN